MVIPLWKEVGQSTHLITKNIAENCGEKAAHTGILDPMAEGVIVVLVGEDRFQRSEYVQTEKEYTVTILVGLSTDTYDLLGVIQTYKEGVKVSKGQLTVAVGELVKRETQRPPSFSSVRVRGKRLYQYVYEGTIAEVEIPERKVHLSSATNLTIRDITAMELQRRIESTVPIVEGHFRQKKVLSGWGDFFAGDSQDKFQLITLTLRTGPGYYVRSFVRDLGELLSEPLTTYSLVRSENAHFTREDCLPMY